MSRVQEIIKELSSRKRSISCNGKDGLLLLMQELGFEYKAGKTEGHKVFIHTHLSESGFYGHSIDCGHAPARPMKFQYVVNTITVLRKYDSQLADYLRERSRSLYNV